MSLIASTTNINISSVTSLELKSLAKLFYLIFVFKQAFSKILNLTNIANTSLSQIKLIKSGKIVIYKKKYTKIFEK